MPKSRTFRPLSLTTNSQAKRNASPGPPSPTYSDTTNASAVHFGENGPTKIITRSDLKASMQSYENVSDRLVVIRLPPQPCRTLILACTDIAPELMHQLPICPSRDVESHRHTCGRNGNLLWVCVLLIVGGYTHTAPTSQDEGPLVRTGDPPTGCSGLASSNGQPLACPGTCPPSPARHLLHTYAPSSFPSPKR
jgi:hypothetical protein